MRLYIIDIIFEKGKRKRYPVFAEDERSAKGLALYHFDKKYAGVINPPRVKLTKLYKEFKIKRGVING